MTSKEIARQLGISPSTVDNHLRVAAMRLGVRNRREAGRLFRNAPGESPANNESEAAGDLVAHSVGEVSELGIRDAYPFRLPPLGGKPNQSSISQRLSDVALIALVGTMLLSAIGFTISGLIAIFDP